jgi:hypothetical protein
MNKAKWAVEGETISKYWSKINSMQKPRDVIHKLRIPNMNCFATRSVKMVDISQKHHEDLLSYPILRTLFPIPIVTILSIVPAILQ